MNCTFQALFVVIAIVGVSASTNNGHNSAKHAIRKKTLVRLGEAEDNMVVEGTRLLTDATRLLQPMKDDIMQYALKSISQARNFYSSSKSSRSSNTRALEEEGSALMQKASRALQPLNARAKDLTIRVVSKASRALGLSIKQERGIIDTIFSPVKFMYGLITSPFSFAYKIFASIFGGLLGSSHDDSGPSFNDSDYSGSDRN